MSEKNRRVALLERYGLAGWICCGGHSIPRVIEILHQRGVEVHFFGPRSMDTLPPGADAHVTVHTLPFTWDRANPMHKWNRTILWYLVLPFIALYCRVRRFDAMVHIDDTLPLSGWILRIFFGPKIVLTVMDFFMRIYTERHPLLRPVGRFVEWLDMQSWLRTPVLFTKVLYTQEFLKAKGVPPERLFVARNPCNHNVFCPLLPDARHAVRRRYGFSDGDFVITHHGIMHPNKGNDWVIRRLWELQGEMPNIKFLLMGDGPDMHHIKLVIGELGMQARVQLPGWMPDERSLNEALNAGDVGLAMRIGQETDNFHMTDALSHEMACGKPLLAARLRGIAEIIRDGENGMLFSPDRPEEFREKLLVLHGDAALRRRMGEQALATSREVSDLEVCAHQVADPIGDLVFSD